MPSSSNILALTALLALTTLPSNVIAARPQKKNLRQNNNRNLRRGQINHSVNPNKVQKKEKGFEEDVTFWTNMVRKTQEMSVPTGGSTIPPVSAPVPTNPPVGGGPVTDPPVGGVPVPTNPPVGGGPVPSNPPQPVVSGPPVPVAGIVCASGETCTVAGDTCTDGTTEECCDEIFPSFICTCEEVDGTLQYAGCLFTDACLAPQCGTPAPTDAGAPPSPPPPTPPPIPEVEFNCPAANLVGCTAVDPSDPQDECPTIGEPCAGNNGEFCCPDACPRNYCTAKQATSSLTQAKMAVTETSSTAFVAPIDKEEVLETLEVIEEEKSNEPL